VATNRTKIEALSSTDMNKRIAKSNRQVRFHQMEFKYIDDSHCKTYEEEQPHTSWYEPADIRMIQNDNEKLIRKYRALIRINPSNGKYKEARSYDFEKQRKKMEDEMRGLEDHLSILSHLLYKRRVAACCQGVLNEQLRQKNIWEHGLHSDRPFILDVDLIRKVSVNNSMKSKMMAYSLGQVDESFVRQEQHNAGEVESVYVENRQAIVVTQSFRTYICDGNIPQMSVQKAASTRAKATASSVLREHVLRNTYSSNLSSDVRMTV
jgi:hypothetical protein